MMNDSVENKVDHHGLLSNRVSKKQTVTTDQYVEKRRFGRLGNPNVEDSDSD